MSLAQALDGNSGESNSGESVSAENNSVEGNSLENNSGENSPAESNSSTESQTSTESQSSADWRTSITDPDLSKFIKNFNTPGDLAKSAFQFRQKLSSAVSVPGSNASEEDLKEFRSKMGVPDSPEGYEYSLPEVHESIDTQLLEPTLNELKKSLHESGATPQTAKSVLDSAINLISKSHEEAAKLWEENVSESSKALKNEWGKDYETNVTYAERAFKQFADPDFVDLLKDTKVGGVELINHPGMYKIFSSIGRKMGEGGLQYVATKEDMASFEQNQDDLTRKAHDALSNGDQTEADRLFMERDKKERAYYGTE